MCEPDHVLVNPTTLSRSEHVAAALRTELVPGFLLRPVIFSVMLVASAHAVLPCRDGVGAQDIYAVGCSKLLLPE